MWLMPPQDPTIYIYARSEGQRFNDMGKEESASDPGTCMHPPPLLGTRASCADSHTEGQGRCHERKKKGKKRKEKKGGKRKVAALRFRYPHDYRGLHLAPLGKGFLSNLEPVR